MAFWDFSSFFSFLPLLLIIRLQLHTETKRSILNHSFFQDFSSSDFLLMLGSSCVFDVFCLPTRKSKTLHEKQRNRFQMIEASV